MVSLASLCDKRFEPATAYRLGSVGTLDAANLSLLSTILQTTPRPAYDALISSVAFSLLSVATLATYRVLWPIRAQQTPAPPHRHTGQRRVPSRGSLKTCWNP